MNKLRVLVACEFSGIVRDAFLRRGHDAMSCDLLPTENPGPHYQGDVRDILANNWDMVIAFPPCTHIAVSGAAWFKAKQKDGRQRAGIDFFMLFTDLKCAKVAIENPVGIMSTIWRKPDQIIQPYQHGHEIKKQTCLWLKGLPLLQATKIVSKGDMVTFPSGKVMPKWYADAYGSKDRSKIRSRTYQGVADAMAMQWGG